MNIRKTKQDVKGEELSGVLLDAVSARLKSFRVDVLVGMNFVAVAFIMTNIHCHQRIVHFPPTMITGTLQTPNTMISGRRLERF